MTNDSVKDTHVGLSSRSLINSNTGFNCDICCMLVLCVTLGEMNFPVFLMYSGVQKSEIAGENASILNTF